jgi:GrpB-like predicted nucleotidyltransferase (UPF0157 family)
MFPGFELLPDSARGDPIELVSYDPVWPSRFQAWKDKLLSVLKPSPRRIDHIGSTAISGLKAKPSIDIQVTVDDMLREAVYVPAIESLGVQLRSRDSDHRYFRPFAGRPRDVHIHVCTSGGEWERRHLLFVAYLRHDAAARLEYMQAKEAACARWADDRAAYTGAKDAVIRAIQAKAEAWAAETGWDASA